MSKHSLLGLLAILLPAALVACSSEDDSSTAPGAAPSVFAGYCTGTLLTEQEFMAPDGNAGWSGNGSKLPAGTSILVEASGGRWIGYAFTADGTPQQVYGDFSTGLVKGTDFSSGCATDPSVAAEERVVLMESSIYETKELVGTPCKIPAGTRLSNFSYMGGWTGPASVEFPQMKDLCGFEKGYSGDFIIAALIVN